MVALQHADFWRSASHWKIIMDHVPHFGVRGPGGYSTNHSHHEGEITMTTPRPTLSKKKLYPLFIAGMLLMAAVLTLFVFDYTQTGLLLLVYGVGAQLIVRAVLEWTDGIRTFYWRLLLGIAILLLMSSVYLFP